MVDRCWWQLQCMLTVQKTATKWIYNRVCGLPPERLMSDVHILQKSVFSAKLRPKIYSNWRVCSLFRAVAPKNAVWESTIAGICEEQQQYLHGCCRAWNTSEESSKVCRQLMERQIMSHSWAPSQWLQCASPHHAVHSSDRFSSKCFLLLSPSPESTTHFFASPAAAYQFR